MFKFWNLILNERFYRNRRTVSKLGSITKLSNITCGSSSDSLGMFDHVVILDQSRASKTIWWIIIHIVDSVDKIKLSCKTPTAAAPQFL